MKVWRCLARDAGLGAMVSWHGSEREARKALAAHRRERGGPADGPESVEPADIPTDKAGLLGWLNTHFKTDNG